ncbi:MAG: SUMF1/EgtB/PvdO family nonheme iron enzyme [Caldilineaceae bacterium]|nr:SUMF1/EgtB/PvdO family nonheme iron enzyme [Caldilineaceae bacterium]
MSIEYLDFELEIGTGDGRTYPLAVLHSPAGHARAHFDFGLSQLEVENRLLTLQNALLRSGGERRTVLSREERTVRDFGQNLFNTLFQNEIRSLFHESKRMAASQGKFLRVKLRILDAQMAALPWEYLFDARQNEYLCLTHNTPLIRYLEVAQPHQPLRIEPPLRVLGMVASPSDLEPLKVDVEKERLARALAALIADGLVELEWLPGQSWRDLHRAMRPNQGPWHVFHFVGHGGFHDLREEGVLLFADRTGQSDPRTATEVGRLLSGQPTLRLALLNACEGATASRTDIFASTAATLVRRGLPAVIAMQYQITDRAAIEFAEQFYDALTVGLPVDGAVTDARRAVSLAINNTLEWGIPVLFMQAPDGVVFEFGETGVGSRKTGVGSREDASAGVETATREMEQETSQLTGEQMQRLWQALLDAYTPITLPRMVRFQLNERLDQIAGGENFGDWVYQLIDWAERTGRLPELIGKAQAFNPGNAQLRQVARELLGEAVAPPMVETETDSATETTPPEPARPPLPITPIAFEWCYVPAGEFVMGSDDHHDDEKPQHTVNLPDFYISKTPVTNAQYKHFVEATNHRVPDHWQNGQIPKGKENHPVVNVSWHDARAFCAWANVQLPSEAQWEKAARGTDGRIYPWGNQPPTDKLCNFNNNVKDTTPVDRYSAGASPYGCLDMAGNVWEWTSSLYKPYPYEANDGREDPEADGRRTWRGGSFDYDDNGVRCAFRLDWYPDSRYYGCGFRILSPGAVGR